MTLRQLLEIKKEGRIQILLDKSFGESADFKIDVIMKAIDYLDIKDNEISKILDIWVESNCQCIKVRVSNKKNLNTQELKVKDLLNILGNINHKDYTERKICMMKYSENKTDWGGVIEREYGDRLEAYADSPIKSIIVDGGELGINILSEN